MQRDQSRCRNRSRESAVPVHSFVLGTFFLTILFVPLLLPLVSIPLSFPFLLFLLLQNFFFTLSLFLLFFLSFPESLFLPLFPSQPLLSFYFFLVLFFAIFFIRSHMRVIGFLERTLFSFFLFATFVSLPFVCQNIF